MNAIRSRFIATIRDLPIENLPLLLTMGLILGLFPVWGCATLLCLGASLLLRVNFPALLLVNQLSWPLQVAMLIPFARMGSRIIPPSRAFPATFIERLGNATVQAVVGWFCVSVPLGLLLYLFLYLALTFCLPNKRRPGLGLSCLRGWNALSS